MTNQFGAFRVTGLTPNETYTVSVAARDYQFLNRTITATDGARSIEIVAEP